MKLGSKRGSAVLDAPEETYASETEMDGSAGWEPAPAGALQRGGSFAGSRTRAGHQDADEEYVPRRGGKGGKAAGGLRIRLIGGMPKTVAGWLVVGSLGLLVLGAVVVAIAGIKHSLLHDDRFTIATSSEIEIQGNQHLTRDEILSVFGADLERNIFKVPLAERKADLERLPWVAHATVMRLLPNRLRVSIVERTPVAFVRQGTQIGLVDANGVLLDMPADAAGDPHYSFPVLTGLNASDPLSVRAARMAVYAKFMKDLSSGGDGVTRSLSEVDVTDPEDVKAIVASGGADILVHFGDENFLNRYREFEEHLPQWKQQYPKLASADMRYERQVVLEMAPGATMPGGAGPAAGSSATGTGAAAMPASTVPASAAAAVSAPVVQAASHKATARPRSVAAKRESAAERRQEKHERAVQHAMELRIARAREARVAGTVALGPAQRSGAASYAAARQTSGQAVQ